jgi:hypothetical protein
MASSVDTAKAQDVRRTPGVTGVLLVHGGWHGPWCWDDFAERLAGRGHDVRTVELRGHDQPNGRIWHGVRGYVQDVERAAAHFLKPRNGRAFDRWSRRTEILRAQRFARRGLDGVAADPRHAGIVRPDRRSASAPVVEGDLHPESPAVHHDTRAGPRMVLQPRYTGRHCRLRRSRLRSAHHPHRMLDEA